MTDTTEAEQMSITGERMNPTGTRTESPGMDGANLKVCPRTRKMTHEEKPVLTPPSSTLDDRIRPEERRRNELYRQYYEELQRRYDTDRPVDCSVIVVNKAQKYVSSLL